MKKKKLNSLKLNKQSISNLELYRGGAEATCQSPCQGGTTCCSVDGKVCKSQIGDGLFCGFYTITINL